MALVFRHSSEEPARCALEVAEALKEHPQITVRMGINSGPVSEVIDVSGRTNIAGPGINLAQRVMDCGDAGHILVSRRVAEDLEAYRSWAPHLHSLGEAEVKHGLRIQVANLYTDKLGNPAVPAKLRSAKAAGESAAEEKTDREQSVAVLPFVNMSPDKSDEYLSDGMTEELINALAKVPGLRVPGRTS
jgi:hypothetical protein